jgi:membrane protease YdiL (CAAX protease family)
MSTADSAVAPAPEALSSALSAEHSVSRSQRLAGLLIVLAVAFVPLVFSSVHRLYEQPPASSSAAYVQYGYFSLLLTELTSLALLAYVVRQNGQTFSQFGLVFQPSDVFYGMSLWAVTRLSYRLVYPVILAACESLGWHWAPPYLPSLKLGLGLLTYVFVVVNPVFEEMIVRAFLMSETIALTGSSVLAVLFSFLLQTSYHLYQGLPYALAAGVTFLIFSIYYARTRRIAPLIIAHFTQDLLAHASYAMFQARAGHS